MWPETAPSKFIIWGLPHYSHTHSYIHYAFHKAAKHLGWDTEWVDDTKENADLFSNSDGYLFMTANICDQYVPKNPNAFYFLHNCHLEKYTNIPPSHFINTSTSPYSKSGLPLVQNQPYHTWLPGECYYLVWATDLLPHEINENIEKVKKGLIPNKDRQVAIFLGSCTICKLYGNNDEHEAFDKGMKEMGMKLEQWGSTVVEQDKSIDIIQSAFMAPTLVGTWQKKNGYIPCRLFKTISYGHVAITNSKESCDIINGLSVYNSDETQLAKDAVQFLNSDNCESTRIAAMELVRDKHTYINRIDTLQYIFRQLKKHYSN